MQGGSDVVPSHKVTVSSPKGVVMDISAGDKLTIITSTHVLVCTVTQIRGRYASIQAEQPGQPAFQSGQPPIQSDQDQPDQPEQPEANILLEIEVQDVINQE